MKADVHSPSHLLLLYKIKLTATLCAMDSRDLTPAQCKILSEQLGPIQRYLHALHERCRQTAFPEDDKVRQLAETAHDAVFSLNVELHYLSCKTGVSRPRRER